MIPGVYDAEVLGHWLTTSQAGNAGLSVKVLVADKFGATEEMVGTIWLTAKSMRMARTQLKALGFDVDTQEIVTLNENPEEGMSLVGHKCQVTLKEDDYRNRIEIRIAFFGGGAKPPTAEQLAAAQRGLRAAKGKAKAAPEVNTDAINPATKGEDIPF